MSIMHIINISVIKRRLFTRDMYDSHVDLTSITNRLVPLSSCANEFDGFGCTLVSPNLYTYKYLAISNYFLMLDGFF